MLRGISVVESGNSLATAITGMILAECGARVVRLDSVVAPHAAPTGLLHRGKTIIQQTEGSDDTLMRELARADVLVYDETSAMSERANLDGKRIVCRFVFPEVLTSSIRSHLMADYHLSAAASLFEPLTGFGRPVPFAFPLPSLMAALYGVNAIAASLIGVARSGKSERITIDIIEAALAALSLKVLVTSRKHTGWSPIQWVSSPFTGIWKTANRHVYLHLGMARHLERFLDCIAKNGFAGESSRMQSLLDDRTRKDPVAIQSVHRAFRLQKILGKVMAAKDASFWETLLGNEGLCCAMVRSRSEWLQSPEAHANGMVRDENHAAIGPACPLHFSTIKTGDKINSPLHPDGKKQECGTLPLDGYIVADFTNIIAGPVASRTLAEFGARVIRVENPSFSQYFAEPFHVLFNSGKESTAIDLQTPEGRTINRALWSHFKPDMIVNNFRIGVDERLGLSAKNFMLFSSPRVFLHLNAFGPSGAWKSFRGFEQTIQAACGFQAEYGNTEEPRLFAVPINDLTTGLLGSFGAMAACYRSLIDGNTHTANASLCASGTLICALTNVVKSAADTQFHGLFRARDRWMYVSAEDPAQLRALLALKDSAGAPMLLKKNKALFKRYPVKKWQEEADRLSLRGICLTPCRSQKEALASTDPSHPSLIQKHPFKGRGTVTVIGSPVRFERRPLRPLIAAPEKGADSDAVFHEAGIKEKGAPVSTLAKVSKFRLKARSVAWAIYYLFFR
jgi:crotonobetainyl-CoA:carnitine CoA-transferase CaiB-like acyl-CoA transferase